MRLKAIIKKIILPLGIGISAIVVFAQVNQGRLFTLDLKQEITDQNGVRTLTNDNPWREFQLISQRFQGSRDLFYAGTIELKKEEEDQVLEKTTYSCQMNGQNFHYQLDSVDMIYKDGLSLQVFHRERLIVIDKGKPASSGPWTLPNIDSLQRYATQHDTKLFIYQEGAQKVLRVEQTESLDHHAYELYYEPTTYNIKKVKLLMATIDNLDGGTGGIGTEQPDVELGGEEAFRSVDLYLHEVVMSFDKVTFGTKEDAFNPEEKYIHVRKKSIALKDAYKNYRVVLLTDDYKLSN